MPHRRIYDLFSERCCAVALANAFRACGYEFGIDTETFARNPRSFLRHNATEAKEWLRLARTIHRHDHPSGEVGRVAYHRACRALWLFCFGPDRMINRRRPRLIME